MKTILSFVAASVLVLSAPAAKAQQFCAARDEAVKQIELKFQEKVFGRGLAGNGKRMFELFVSEKGSWTMLASDTNGRSCIMASGEDWQGLKRLVGDAA